MKHTVKLIALTSLGFVGIAASAQAQTVSALNENLYFNFDKAEQTQETLDKLRNVTSLVSACGSTQYINLTGHTDTSGNAAYNQALSERRAVKTKNLLVEQGVPRDIIRTNGMGERENLIDLGDNVKNELNRRVNVELQQDSACVVGQAVEVYQQPVEYTQPTAEYVQPAAQPAEVYTPPVNQTVTTTVSTPPAPVAPQPVSAPPVTSTVATGAGGIAGTGIPAVAGIAGLAAIGAGIAIVASDGNDNDDGVAISP